MNAKEMVIARVKEILARVEMRNSAIPITPATVDVVDDELVVIRNYSQVLERDSGEVRTGCTRLAFPLEAIPCFETNNGEEWILDKYKDHLKYIYDHQFQEAYHVDGRRILEPHPNGV